MPNKSSQELAHLLGFSSRGAAMRWFKPKYLAPLCVPAEECVLWQQKLDDQLRSHALVGTRERAGARKFPLTGSAGGALPKEAVLRFLKRGEDKLQVRQLKQVSAPQDRTWPDQIPASGYVPIHNRVNLLSPLGLASYLGREGDLHALTALTVDWWTRPNVSQTGNCIWII